LTIDRQKPTPIRGHAQSFSSQKITGQEKGSSTPLAMVVIVCLMGIGLFLSQAFAGEAVPVRTLEWCLLRALAQNLSVRQAELGHSAKKFQTRAALKEMLPILSTEYAYTGRRDANTIDFEGRSIPISSRDNYDWTLAFTQPIFHGGALWNRYLIAQLGEGMAQLEIERVRQDITRQVKEAYYSVLKAQRGQQEAEATVERLESHLRVAQGFYDVGLIAKNDLLQSKVELAQAQQDLIKARHDVALAKARLNLLLRENVGAPIEIEDTLDSVAYAMDLGQAQAKACVQRREILAGELGVRKARKELAVARGSYWPNVDLMAQYEKRGVTPDVSDNPFGDHDMAQIMAVATWELWAWGKTRDEVQAAIHLVQQAEAVWGEVKDAVALEVQEAWLRLKEAEANIAVAKVALVQAEENYRLNAERYKEQLATSTDVLDAQALLTKANVNSFNALADYHIAQARLEFAIGSNL
jgi:outer membrane protein